MRFGSGYWVRSSTCATNSKIKTALALYKKAMDEYDAIARKG
ncbi:hypothetical protein ACQ5SK_00265 [Bradyrhizobium japonicum]